VIPKRLRINGRVFKITLLPADSDALGLMHGDAGEIQIKPCDDMFVTKDTVLHEAMHAVRYMQGREDGGEVEEDYVRSLATGILGILRDNPTFAKWLIAK
jgi:hypothetical protein